MLNEICAAAIAEIQDILRGILAAGPDGMAEHDLLKALAARELDLFDDEQYGGTLGLFQRHFLLFHCLYLLRNGLRESGQGDLQIDCLCIRFLPHRDNPSEHPARPDPLAGYYLDLGNLESTGEAEVLGLLEDFWKRYTGEERRDEALAVMELEHPVSFPDIRQQYRRLAMQWHPDRGGDPARFQRLEWAMGVLRTLYQ